MTGIVDGRPVLTMATSLPEALMVVYRDRALLAVGAGRSFTDLSAWPGRTYRYAVHAVDRQAPNRRAQTSGTVALTVPGQDLARDPGQVVVPHLSGVQALSRGAVLLHRAEVFTSTHEDLWRSVVLYRNGLPVVSGWMPPQTTELALVDDVALRYGQRYTYHCAVRHGGALGPESNLVTVGSVQEPGLPPGERMIAL